MSANKEKWFIENPSGDLYAGPGQWVSPSRIDDAEPFDTEVAADLFIAMTWSPHPDYPGRRMRAVYL